MLARLQWRYVCIQAISFLLLFPFSWFRIIPLFTCLIIIYTVCIHCRLYFVSHTDSSEKWKIRWYWRIWWSICVFQKGWCSWIWYRSKYNTVVDMNIILVCKYSIIFAQLNNFSLLIDWSGCRFGFGYGITISEGCIYAIYNLGKNWTFFGCWLEIYSKNWCWYSWKRIKYFECSCLKWWMGYFSQYICIQRLVQGVFQTHTLWYFSLRLYRNYIFFVKHIMTHFWMFQNNNNWL